MDKNLLAKQQDAFAKIQKDFEEVKNKYLEEIKKYKYFADKSFLSSPPVKRAAYSDRMAWVMASMSQLAYEKFETEDAGASLGLFISKLDSGGFTFVEKFSVAGTQAFLAHHDDYAVLAFRGTEKDWRDIQTDIRAKRVKTSEGKVHAGFNEAYDLVAQQIEDALPRVNGLPLYITGHSLGGALATVATQKLEETKFRDQIAACYTFGSPRVGNAEYDKHIKVPFYRVVNFFDIVTFVPLGTMGFMDVGDVRYLTRKGELRRYTPFYRKTLLAFLVLPTAIGNHGIAHYADKLWNIMLDRNPGLKKSS